MKKLSVSFLGNDFGKIIGTLDLSLSDLCRCVCKKNWSAGTFKDGIRRISNWISSDILALDIDSGCTIEEAKEKFKGYKAIFATTKSHQKEKNGIICDRFRVLLPLELTITSESDYRATWFAAFKLWPFIDEACKDPSRFFYPSGKVVHIQDGIPFPITKEEPKTNAVSQVVIPNGIKGLLSAKTKDFITLGAPDGEWNCRLHLAAVDMKEQQYSFDEAISLLKKASPVLTLDSKDMSTIEGVFNRDVKYAPRLPKTEIATIQGVFNLPDVVEEIASYDRDSLVMEDAKTRRVSFMNPCVDKIAYLEPGVTICGALTGTGKTTVALNVSYNFLKNEPVKKVVYISNEMSSSVVKDRVSCLFLGKSFDYRYLSPEQKEIVRAKSRELSDRFTVVDQNAYDMTVVEEVYSVLEAIERRRGDVGLLIIDYLQTISVSKDPKVRGRYEASKRFGDLLLAYGKRNAPPVLAFAQLKTTKDSVDFTDRVEGDKTICNHSVLTAEIIRTKDTNQSKILFHKDRNGEATGKVAFFLYKNGLLVPQGDESPTVYLSSPSHSDEE